MLSKENAMNTVDAVAVPVARKRTKIAIMTYAGAVIITSEKRARMYTARIICPISRLLT